MVGFLAACGVGGRILEVAGAETEAEAADVSEDTAQKVAMFCVSSACSRLLKVPCMLCSKVVERMQAVPQSRL